MKYPMKEVESPFSGTTYIEMTSNEYDIALSHYACLMTRYELSSNRRDKEYAGYLKRWFGPEKCDGLPNYDTRHNWHQLPMSYNVYFG